MIKRFHILFLVIFAELQGSATEEIYTGNPNELKYREAIARRINTPPTIDGLLNDAVWNEAIPVKQFFQTEPIDLGKPSERTVVYVLYDDENIYIAFRNFDAQPEKIMKRLTRRDDWMGGFEFNSDWVGFGIDSRNDDKNGYWFALNAAGVKVDVTISKDEEFDNSWDAVWDGEMSIDDKGWIAEIRVPISVFQFSSAEEQIWGIEFMRSIYRHQEFVQWPGRAKGTKGVVSWFGVLKGLKNIPPPNQLEILPYALGGRTDSDGLDYTNNIGLDLEYGLSSNTTVNLTFNPDFGQVEADPSVLNLTAFETFFMEKRPFFVEGGAFFRNRYQLFHSRRIGKTPNYFTPENGSIIDAPENTTILGAMKILGQTNSGINFGIIESVTDEEYGTWEVSEGDSTQLEKILLEPYTNHLIARIEIPLINDFSNVGMMVTDIHRQRGDPAIVIGGDWQLKFLNNAFTFSGQLVQSRANNTIGNGGRFFIGYRNPKWWELKFGAGFTDDKFEINDLGYMKRNDTRYTMFNGELRKQDPWWKFLSNLLDIRLFTQFRGDGLNIAKALDINQMNFLKNYWSFGLGFHIEFGDYNDGDTFKDSRAWVYQSELNGYAYVWVQTDRRKKIILKPMVGFGRGKTRGWGYRIGTELTLRPTDNISFSVNGIQDFTPSVMEWVGVEEDSVRENIVYAVSESLMDDIQVRLNWTFTPDLSFEFFLQPFNVNMDYLSFYRLTEEKTRNLSPYSYEGNPDFKIDNTVGTFVIRWEYFPGSLLYVVYNLNDNRYYSGNDGEWYNTKANSLFFKLNYFFQS